MLIPQRPREVKDGVLTPLNDDLELDLTECLFGHAGFDVGEFIEVLDKSFFLCLPFP
jgi:hypothetical protein